MREVHESPSVDANPACQRHMRHERKDILAPRSTRFVLNVVNKSIHSKQHDLEILLILVQITDHALQEPHCLGFVLQHWPAVWLGYLATENALMDDRNVLKGMVDDGMFAVDVPADL